MSSQYGEHSRILEYFAGQPAGRFLDIGAFDGKTFSNTKPLADLGWSGVCVEPSPPAFCWLMETYKGNQNVQLVNAAIGSGQGLIPFFVSRGSGFTPLDADMVSTTNQSHVELWKEAAEFRAISIPMVPAHALFAMGPFDFLNIDVEGSNLAVLVACCRLPELRMICVEADPLADVSEMHSNLDQWGFPGRATIGGNILAWR